MCLALISSGCANVENAVSTAESLQILRSAGEMAQAEMFSKIKM